MQTKAAKIYLKTPYRKWLWLGGMAACVIPVLCGLVFIGFLILAEMALSSNELEAQSTNDIGYLVLGVIPVLGAVLAAYLGTREILWKNQLGFENKKSILWTAVKAGFYAHWTIAFLLFLLMLIFSVASRNIEIFSLILFIIFGTIGTFAFWAFVTLPVSLACGYVFWFVAVRGSENLMAEVFD